MNMVNAKNLTVVRMTPDIIFRDRTTGKHYLRHDQSVLIPVEIVGIHARKGRIVRSHARRR
jgi:hypothetical protein